MCWRRILWLTVLTVSLTGCGLSEKPGDSLTIVSITPSGGSTIDSNTTFTATFHYVMQDNEKGHYIGDYMIFVYFAAKSVDWTGVMAGRLDEQLSGTVTLSFRCPSVFYDTLAVPYRMRFDLVIEEEPTTTLATSGEVTYQAK
jgi:hypothetical protein